MDLIQLLTLSLGIFFLINYLANKYKFLLDNKKSSFHKIFIDKNSNPPFTGGSLFLLALFLILPNTEINLKVFLFLIFMTGFLSDIGILKSANLRFIIQLVIVLFALTILEKYVHSIKWAFLDNLLINVYFKLFFSSFCILIIINGTNFIDGLNSLAIGYYLIIFIFISSFYKNNDLLLVSHQIIILISIILFSLLILNSFNLLYLGDNGAYLLAFFASIILIDLSANLKNLSPYYIANLLWYPAYENLFSIIRKVKNKKSALEPDNLHLHQLMYLKIKKTLKFNSKIINTFSGMVINIFNFGVLILATQNYSSSRFQIILLLISVAIYNLTYIVLKNNLQK
jgi:UDP-N-acetylmuramyl pentapeptide phosphotransferase/UDP-N-acetylglucosamine-1-phosphate transferase